MAADDAGPCTATVGILSYSEIVSLLANPSNNAMTTLYQTEAVKIATYGGNQWIGYDDPETLNLKLNYAGTHCIGG
jgi:chitinase